MSTPRRLRFNNVLGTATSNGLTFSTNSTTTGNWAIAPNFPTIVAPDFAVIVAEPGTANEEITYLTAYTSGATTGTFARAQEGSTGIIHTTVAWECVPTALDFNAVSNPLLPIQLADIDLIWAPTSQASVTYNNGTAGIGATLTNNGTQAALVVDGVSVSVNQRIGVTSQVVGGYTRFPGIYTVTNIGSNSTNWVLTRATDCDTPNILGYPFYTTAYLGNDFAGWSMICIPYPATYGSFVIGSDNNDTNVAILIPNDNDYPTNIEGAGNVNATYNAHVEGYLNYAEPNSGNSHTEGSNNTNNGSNNHIEGQSNSGTGSSNHIEGNGNSASGSYQHVEGNDNVGGGDAQAGHVEGQGNVVNGEWGHVEGAGNILNSEAIAGHAAGHGSLSYWYAMEAMTSAFINTPGDAQVSKITGAIQTIGTTSETIQNPGGTPIVEFVDNNINPIYNRTVRVRTTVVARRIDTPGTDSVWTADGVIRGNGTSAYTWIGAAPTFIVLAQDSGATTWTLAWSIVGNALSITATGSAGATINWMGTLELFEVAG